MPTRVKTLQRLEHHPSNQKSYWDMGTATQAPGLVLKGKTYRDSDLDSAADPDDRFPSTQPQALTATAMAPLMPGLNTAMPAAARPVA